MPAVTVPPIESMPWPSSESMALRIHVPIALPAKAKRTLRTKGMAARRAMTPGFSIAEVPAERFSTSGESSVRRSSRRRSRRPCTVPR